MNMENTKPNITHRLPFLSGKIRTSNLENIELQKLFINNGFSFLNGSTELKERDNLEYFYFENNIISLGSKTDIYTNHNPFKLKILDGETHFKKKKLKERDVASFLG